MIYDFKKNLLIFFNWCIGYCALCIFFFSCNTSETNKQPESSKAEIKKPKLNAPSFNADSAFSFVKTQIDFGPRIPGTKAHANCAAYLSSKLISYGMDVIVQNGIVTTYDKKKFDLKNIIAQYNLSNPRRILLCAHWDTRPFADRDSNNPSKPFDGANDGGSGVAVLLEIARQLNIAKPNLGIDIILFDVEDYGDQSGRTSDSWCLGSQYWGKNLHRPNYFAQYGILLDMVGGRDAVFPKEGTGMKYASGIVNKVWGIARQTPYSNFFSDTTTPETTDDHYYVNTLASIPCIDIVHYNTTTMDYMACHHRHCDNMDIVDASTLKAVGQVLLEVLFYELNQP